MSKLIFYLDFGQDCVFSTLNITEGGTTGGTTWWWWYPHLPTPWPVLKPVFFEALRRAKMRKPSAKEVDF